MIRDLSIIWSVLSFVVRLNVKSLDFKLTSLHLRRVNP